MQNALTISGNNLTLDDIYQVSHKHRPVEIEEKSMELLVNTRKLVFELSDRECRSMAVIVESAGIRTKM